MDRTDSEIREELQLIGLSDKEIDTYLSLLSHGESTTGTIAEHADVTQRAVYNIAERLEERGLVEVKDYASPTVITPIPPGEAIGELSDRIDAIIPQLESQFTGTASQTPTVQMVETRETAIRHFKKAIRDAECSALVSLPSQLLEELEPELRNASERGVLILLLLGNGDPQRPTEFSEVADIVRIWDEQVPFLYATDDHSAMVGPAELLSSPHSEEHTVTVTETHLAGAISGMFLSAYWPAGREVYVTEPAPLPASYDCFRQAVLQARRHLQNGSALEATVVTVDNGTYEGKVTAVHQGLTTPRTNDYPLETSILVETDSGLLSFGGSGAFIEDYQAKSVILRPATT
ncbi:TrmB family transcriptional regulator [Halapricum hydrolyticum]|uniref:TrmB family transcriptional regulator n=1 Tax=Halapricum hydrolyticum TaxID=2979991 RepID=A0AAE3IF27_9EURY|nr:TrmB family transcriptional regulator sugar-binding domain-containing protein [Halapricum hydrolyticum]MCU4718537.1 TrmB family transcriptional regulator [Halapricum hydrolyticum]MCU4727444.1 TrmB family transcriptional regulator [Halapricum hydrolyticum]